MSARGRTQVAPTETERIERGEEGAANRSAPGTNCQRRLAAAPYDHRNDVVGNLGNVPLGIVGAVINRPRGKGRDTGRDEESVGGRASGGYLCPPARKVPKNRLKGKAELPLDTRSP